jgi:hypothetical protein
MFGPHLIDGIGGYGAGSSQQDLTYIINENGNNFVGVAIQYRVRLKQPSLRSDRLTLPIVLARRFWIPLL